MERRYLAATLVLAATFALFSGEFCVRSLAKVPHSKTQLNADIACARSYVAKQLMAKLEPYVGSHASEARPMLAELVVPELPPSPAAPMAPQMSARQKCEAAARAHSAPHPIIEMRVMNDDAMKSLNDLSVVRAELLSDRAQEWQTMVNQNSIAINMKSLEQAQRMSAHAMERAQHELQKSRVRINVPAAPSGPIHINFVAPTITVTPEPLAPSLF